MKALLFFMTFFVSIFFGCGGKPTSLASQEVSGETIGATFKEGKGLLLPIETSESIGLQTVEVSEQKITSRYEISLRIYRIEAGRAWASGFVSSEQASVLHAGMTGSIQTASNAAPTAVKIVGFDKQVEKANGQSEVLVEFSKPALHFSAGDFLTASFSTGNEETVVSVPHAAVLETTAGKSVYAVNGERLFRTPVKTGADDGAFVEITEGLYAGDKVVVHPVMTLWMTELHNVNGGDACCVAPKPGK